MQQIVLSFLMLIIYFTLFFFRALSIFFLLGNQWGGVTKLQRLKQANLEGILPNNYGSNAIHASSVMDEKLLDEWNFDMNA